jgi:hypothetical protein
MDEQNFPKPPEETQPLPGTKANGDPIFYSQPGAHLQQDPIEARIEHNRVARQHTTKGVGLLTLGIVAAVGVLTLITAPSDSYNYVQQMSSFASLLGFIFAGAVGYLLAFRIAHPTSFSSLNGRHPEKLNPLRYILVGFGFLFGLVTGGILIVILSYPLSHHACRLSGSKYC